MEKLQGSIKVTSILDVGSIFTITFKNYIYEEDYRFGTMFIRNSINPIGISPSLNIVKTTDYLEQFNLGNRNNITSFDYNLSHTLDAVKRKKFCKCPKILIVDDDESCRSVYKFYIGQYHIPFIEAKNGKEAISSVEIFSSRDCCNYFRIILIDNMMPEMNGIDASFHIYKYLRDHDLEGTKIILATGDNLQLNREDENIFWKILSKPIGFIDFKEEVIKHLI